MPVRDSARPVTVGPGTQGRLLVHISATKTNKARLENGTTEVCRNGTGRVEEEKKDYIGKLCRGLKRLGKPEVLGESCVGA